MILRQFYLNCLAHASYLVGDEHAGVAAVVDPQRDIEQYVTYAREHGMRITHVFLTHLHADFLAGHLELRDRTGAIICLGAKARVFVRADAGRRLDRPRARADPGARDPWPHA
jgi:hydroxyacylglutathione hydrolase